ncbi:MAG TPA: hypothetical protein VET23_04095, partial [Chitinophagaceae bacterium]|nr:hypothetical protein [Chitinophagaceae bacterium]
MKKLLSWLIIFSSFFVINSCQKELSYENGNNLSLGSLQDDGTGNCLPKTVNGTYIQATSLAPATNTINVSVNVTKTGSYTIYSDTVNGYYFLAKGIFAATGVNQVTLKGSGTPLASGINNFLIVYDSTACSIPITVLPLGSGGPASFTLAGTPGNCTGAVINGGYSIGVALNSFNTVVISVNVTTIGTYNISTTATNGMSFSGSGTFAATGVQTVVLNGSGTPVTSGNTTIPITAGSSSCSFTIPVGTPAVGTLGGAPGSCTSATISGIYVISTALTSSNTVQVQVNVTTVGVYTISTNTVSGFGFSASGTFNTTGSQLVTLNGT